MRAAKAVEHQTLPCHHTDPQRLMVFPAPTYVTGVGACLLRSTLTFVLVYTSTRTVLAVVPSSVSHMPLHCSGCRAKLAVAPKASVSLNGFGLGKPGVKQR